jgi:hypothetical protein
LLLLLLLLLAAAVVFKVPESHGAAQILQPTKNFLDINLFHQFGYW